MDTRALHLSTRMAAARITSYMEIHRLEANVACYLRNNLDWTEADTEVPGGKPHLWEESWDDDDMSEDFSTQLRYTRLLALENVIKYGAM